jgi:hypothetical protein
VIKLLGHHGKYGKKFNSVDKLYEFQLRVNNEICIRFNCHHCKNIIENCFYNSYFDNNLFCSFDCKNNYIIDTYGSMENYKKIIIKKSGL